MGKLWLEGKTINYEQLIDLGLATECKSIYQQLRIDSRYDGPKALIADTADAIRFSDACVSERNLRGAYLPANATLAMLVVMEHVTVMGVTKHQRRLNDGSSNL